jgi:thimet oligopeptidase
MQNNDENEIGNVQTMIYAVFLTLWIISMITMSSHVSKSNDTPFNAASITSIKAYFPATTEEINERVVLGVARATTDINSLITLPDDQRTFENTILAYDRLAFNSDLLILNGALKLLKEVHPNSEMCTAALKAVNEIDAFHLNNVRANQALYRACKAYITGNGARENLDAEQQAVIARTLKNFHLKGLGLSDKELAEVKEIEAKTNELWSKFNNNISQSNPTVVVSDVGELAGLSEQFIANLARTPDGGYVLGIDYPTLFNVMQNCSCESTRKSLYGVYANNAYPVNEQVLKDLLFYRDRLAKKLGYPSFAHLSLSDEMVQTPERAEQFLKDILDRALVKAEADCALLMANLPEGITLHDGKMKPWDTHYIKNHYKKNHYTLDNQAIAEYFPMEKTMEGLLAIYSTLLNVDFKQETVEGLWHEDVKLITMLRRNSKEPLGYLFLDLHPRPKKFNHAAHFDVVPGLRNAHGVIQPAVSVVVANLPKSTPHQPSLLLLDDVETLFHEFGHGLHWVLGARPYASFAGYNSIPYDFVELPSQMLEEWLGDKSILQMVSGHYKTGEPLPETMIDAILRAKQFDSGNWLVRQIFLSFVSLEYYKEGEHKDLYTVWHRLSAACSVGVVLDPTSHGYASFGHLPEYNARYYGYLWARVFAHDLFGEFKKHGLLNPAIGKRYLDTILAQGGSQDPNKMLADFLGRAPNNEAFLRSYGLVH